MSHNSRNQGFSYYFFITSEYWIRIRIQEAQKHVDPVDPDSDPQHWYDLFIIIFMGSVPIGTVKTWPPWTLS